MGEVNPEPTTREVQDVTAINVDPALGERLYKAAVIQSHQGTTVRVLSKTLASGKIDVVHYACDLDPDGTPQGKRRIHRITAVAPERFDTELATIQKNLTGSGEAIQGAWIHDMTGMPDLIAQSNSLEEWTRKMAGEIRKTPSA
jgi:hypothetical protein